jgi:hypothetical protein
MTRVQLFKSTGLFIPLFWLLWSLQIDQVAQYPFLGITKFISIKKIFLSTHINAKLKKHQNLSHKAHWPSHTHIEARVFISNSSWGSECFPILAKSISDWPHFNWMKHFLFQQNTVTPENTSKCSHLQNNLPELENADSSNERLHFATSEYSSNFKLGRYLDKAKTVIYYYLGLAS